MNQPTTSCDPECMVGPAVLIIHEGLGSTAIEAQVVRWREDAKRPLDWHYVAGRAVIRTTPEHQEWWLQKLSTWSVRAGAP